MPKQMEDIGHNKPEIKAEYSFRQTNPVARPLGQMLAMYAGQNRCKHWFDSIGQCGRIVVASQPNFVADNSAKHQEPVVLYAGLIINTNL